MLGYSTIAHVGFILLAVFYVERQEGNAAALFYTLTYVMIATLGAFGIIILAESPRATRLRISADFKGFECNAAHGLP